MVNQFIQNNYKDIGFKSESVTEYVCGRASVGQVVTQAVEKEAMDYMADHTQQ